MTTPELRQLGAAIGAASGPVGAFGQAWSGIGDGRPHIGVLFTLVGALIGALTLPLFVSRPVALPSGAASTDGAAAEAPITRVGPGFGALFGFAVGVVAGAFAAFPMGAVMGSLGGAVGGVVAALVWRWLATWRFRALTTACCAAGAAFLAIWAWLP